MIYIHTYSKAYNPIPSSLRRRFQQTQEDVSYTISALIPTLSEQILDQMNIEALTQELQNRSKARNAARRQLQAEPSSLASSVVDLVQEQDTRSDVESAASHTSTSFDEVNASSSMSHSALQSWVESSGSRSPAPSVPDSSAASSTSEAHLSESMISASGANSENHSVNDSGLVCFLISQVESLADDSSFSQTVYLAQLRPQTQPTREQKPSYGTKSKCSVRF